MAASTSMTPGMAMSTGGGGDTGMLAMMRTEVGVVRQSVHDASDDDDDDDSNGRNEADDHGCLLDEQGLGAVIDAVANDGSSQVCPMCNGLVPKTRYRDHITLWCDAIS